MRKTKEVLRLRYERGLGLRQIARSCLLGLGTIHDYLHRAQAAGIGWPLPEGWDEEKLEAALFGAPQVRPADPDKTAPDFAAIHEQKQRHRHVTLQLLWEEYRQANPEGYGYSRYVMPQNMLWIRELVLGKPLFCLRNPQHNLERPRAYNPLRKVISDGSCRC